MSPSPTHGRGAHVQGVTILGANIQGVFVPEARVGGALFGNGRTNLYHQIGRLQSHVARPEID